MQLLMFQVDAFTGQLFAGNPAAVCPLEEWIEDHRMQAIAAENNLSETAFFVPRAGKYQLRWFTPQVEIDLCGHATLASAFVLLNFLEPSKPSVTFETKSGELTVRRDGELLSMDFPSRPPIPCETPLKLVEGLGKKPVEIMASRDYMAVYESEEDIRSLKPDMGLLSEVRQFAFIVTAPGREVDFVSRFFAPNQGIPEDPVTGSAHCTLTPYWAKRLGKIRLHALQVSARGGELWCEDRGDRIVISGRAVRYLEGTIHL